MTGLKKGFIFFGLLIIFAANTALAETFEERFAKGASTFGAELGAGYTFDLPSDEDRTDIKFAFFFPNYQYNLTGLVGKDSWYQGALYWHVEGGFAYALNHDEKYLVGFSPLMVNYKFLNRNRGWAPNIQAGGGFSLTNWKDVAKRELGSEFQFLLHIGGGVEFFRDYGSYSINYRLFHISNSGIERPNIGLNAHVFTLGFSF